ncbi:precorrin-6A reductase [Butyrivibrio sp. NC2002]|uniref:precorrin-6A reductase n=1 Tax=Butyrivibrio sp. NC2002 TaxID=1410610 RepID=UPI000566B8F3|nr:precorrin-6A reductase [Butyrivibrio sp. NC2002]
MKNKILIFGGTTEGRLLAECLKKENIPHAVSVATSYGREIEEKDGETNLFVGKKNAGEMADIMEKEGYLTVVDATHPFAIDVSKQIKEACEIAGAKYLRLLRDTSMKEYEDDNITYAGDMTEAARILGDAEKSGKINGNILFFTGSKDLNTLTENIKNRASIYARVLPNEDSLKKCKEAGLTGKQIIAMQGPFSEEMNIALIREIKASVIVTKESGRTGGFDEKIKASMKCGIKAIIIRNPEKNKQEESYLLEEIIDILLKTADYTDIKDPVSDTLDTSSGHKDKTITLAGIGPGDRLYFTSELREAIGKADIIFGAESVVSRLLEVTVPVKVWYQGDKILKYLDENPGFTNPLVVFSGDISLCSGAKKAEPIFLKNGYTVKKISGISSVSLFAGKLGLSLEDVHIVSAHGRECNVTGYAVQEKELIVLPSNCDHAASICKNILSLKEEYEEIRIIAGIDLGTASEKIAKIAKEDDLAVFSEGKCLLYINNQAARKAPLESVVSDNDLIRGKTPMTKEEVRALSMRRLKLTSDAVFYDIGAGTGSVSVEAALHSPDIKVYSIEKNKDALQLLQKNRDKFFLENMQIVEGEAPTALNDLQAPTHVFIGGSGGRLGEILAAVLNKNDRTRIVINCITLETLTETLEAAKKLGITEPDITMVSITGYRHVGNYHMADAGNPIYIITISSDKAAENAG